MFLFDLFCFVAGGWNALICVSTIAATPVAFLETYDFKSYKIILFYVVVVSDMAWYLQSM